MADNLTILVGAVNTCAGVVDLAIVTQGKTGTIKVTLFLLNRPPGKKLKTYRNPLISLIFHRLLDIPKLKL